MKAETQKAMLAAAGRYIRKLFGEFEPRIASLEKKIADVEQRGVRYRGVYQRSEDYKRGDLVTFDGSMWHATRDTTDEPGPSKDWQMAVKKGRDAR